VRQNKFLEFNVGNKSKAKQGIFSRGKSRYETLKEMNDEHQNTRGLKRRKKVQTN